MLVVGASQQQFSLKLIIGHWNWWGSFSDYVSPSQFITEGTWLCICNPMLFGHLRNMMINYFFMGTPADKIPRISFTRGLKPSYISCTGIVWASPWHYLLQVVFQSILVIIIKPRGKLVKIKKSHCLFATYALNYARYIQRFVHAILWYFGIIPNFCPKSNHLCRNIVTLVQNRLWWHSFLLKTLELAVVISRLRAVLLITVYITSLHFHFITVSRWLVHIVRSTILNDIGQHVHQGAKIQIYYCHFHGKFGTILFMESLVQSRVTLYTAEQLAHSPAT